MSDPAGQNPGDLSSAADRDDLERAVREHGGAMISVAQRFLRNEDDARECVQEAYLRAFAKIRTFEGRSSLRTWLHRIVVNVALGMLRSPKRRDTQLVDDFMPVFDSADCRVEPSWRFDETLEQMLERREVRDLVRRAIQELPDTYRIVLMLRDIEGYDTREVATMLETNIGAIKTRLHRARAALKKQLEPLWSEGRL